LVKVLWKAETSAFNYTHAISSGPELQRVDRRSTKRATHVAKLNQADFSECADCFSADLSRYVQLYERHLGRAEHRVRLSAHLGGAVSKPRKSNNEMFCEPSGFGSVLKRIVVCMVLGGLTTRR
jgi:hypothetical protein